MAGLNLAYGALSSRSMKEGRDTCEGPAIYGTLRRNGVLGAPWGARQVIGPYGAPRVSVLLVCAYAQVCVSKYCHHAYWRGLAEWAG